MIDLKTVKSDNMRKSILPLIVFALLYASNSFSQNACGAAAPPAGALTLPTVGTCSGYASSTSLTAGNIIGTCSGFPTNRRISWYKFVAAAGTCYTLNIATGVATQVALYSACATMVANTAVCFLDGQGIWSAGPNFNYVAGNTYYLRVFTDHPADGTAQSLNICLRTQPTAPNDLCTTATAFDLVTPRSTNNACAHYTAATEGLAQANSNYICAYSMQNTVWYSFVVANSGFPATVTIAGVNCDSYNNNPILLQAGLLTGNCGSLMPALLPAQPTNPPAFPTNGGSCAASAGGMTLTTSAAVAAGQKIYLAIDGYSGANCKFTVVGSQNIVPVPIRLEYFTAWAYPTSNLVRWLTSWELDNNYFEIERSLDGRYFESITKIEGVHNSSTNHLYDFEDKNPPVLAYYRLKQVDYDGRYNYSNVVQVKRDGTVAQLTVSMTNPASNNTRVVISTQKPGKINVRVVDVSGRDLSTQQVSCIEGSNITMQDFSRLASGNYYLVVTQDENRVVKPFVKQ